MAVNFGTYSKNLPKNSLLYIGEKVDPLLEEQLEQEEQSSEQSLSSASND